MTLKRSGSVVSSFQQIQQEQDLNGIQPQRLHELGIYGGAQGIWVDRDAPANSETGPDGVTVGILHTGRHYEDDLSEDGVIYHYPQTSRPLHRMDASHSTSVHAIARGDWDCK